MHHQDGDRGLKATKYWNEKNEGACVWYLDIARLQVEAVGTAII